MLWCSFVFFVVDWCVLLCVVLFSVVVLCDVLFAASVCVFLVVCCYVLCSFVCGV